MWRRVTRDLRKKGIKNSQSLYDVLVRARQQLKNTQLLTKRFHHVSLPLIPPAPTGDNGKGMKPSISIKESEEPATKVVVLADSDQEGQDVDFEPPASTIKSSTEALRLVDDLKEFASTTLQDEVLVSK